MSRTPPPQESMVQDDDGQHVELKRRGRKPKPEGWFRPKGCRVSHYFRANKRVMYPGNSQESLCDRRFWLRNYGMPADLKAICCGKKCWQCLHRKANG